NEWIESLKNKFKRERRPLQQTSAEVQQMKVKYGNSIGRPIKRTNNLIAPRRVIFDEVRYVCNVDIELNLKSMLPKLLDCIPDNSGFVDGE
ncbi:unnamed protein product, partial [Rotaria sp. Silwood2]